MFRTSDGSTSPFICPGALMKNGTGAISSTFVGSSRRLLSTPIRNE
jgi:hypothetical protein